jgi:hypothetical protein
VERLVEDCRGLFMSTKSLMHYNDNDIIELHKLMVNTFGEEFINSYAENTFNDRDFEAYQKLMLKA